MKKTILFSVLATLCLFFSAQGQPKNTIKPLKIGDQLPDILLSDVINSPTTTINTRSLRGKVIILDFWATWCQPCVAAFPKLKSLQDKFKNDLLILQVAYQPANTISDFYTSAEKLGTPHEKLTGIVNDNLLIHLFPHTYLPHFVWLDQKGTVIAITEEQEVNEENIAKLLHHQQSVMAEKKDEPMQSYDNHLPIFFDNNGRVGKQLIYHSLLTGYVPGLLGGVTRYPLDSLSGLKITVRNVPLLWLFRTAYEEADKMFMPNRTVIQVRDSAKVTSRAIGQQYIKWLKDGHGFCYELGVPPSLARQAYQLMQRDIALFFPEYDISIRKRSQPCWVLIRAEGQKAVGTAGGKPEAAFTSNHLTLKNVKLGALIVQLNGIYMQASPFPVIDETHLDAPVDLSVDADLSDVQSLNKGLKPYGLQFIKATRSIDNLYIEDHPQ